MKSTITALRLHNLKATSAAARTEYSFPAPITVVHGANGSGKSRLRDAIYLALLGYHPELGKSGPALAKLAGPGKVFGSSVFLSTGGTFTRTWKRTKKGASKDEVPEGECPIPLATLDAGAFLAANSATRAAMVAAAFGMSGDPKAAIAEKIRAGLGAELAGELTLPKAEDFAEWAEELEEHLKAKAAAANAVARRMKTSLEGVAAVSTASGMPLPHLKTALANAQEMRTTAKTELRLLLQEMERLERELSGMDQGLYVDIRSKADIEADLKKILPRLQELSMKESNAAGSARLGDRLRAQLIHASGALAFASTQVAAATEAAKLRPFRAGEEITLEELEELEEDASAACDAAQAALNDARADFRQATQDHHDAKKKIIEGEVCQCCGAKREHWNQDSLWEAERDVAAAAKTLQSFDSAAQAAAAEVEEKNAYLHSITARMNLEKALQKLANCEKAEADFQASIAELPTFSAEEAAELEDLRQQDAALDKELQYALQNEQITAKAGELATARQKLQESQAKAQELKSDLEQLEAKVVDLEAKVSSAQEAQTQEDQMGRMQEELKKATEEKGKWDAAQEILTAAQAEETLKIYAPVLESARKMAAGCLPTPLDHKGLDLGRYEGPHFIHLDTFSTSEKAVAVSAILAALSKGEGLVLIDEFSTFDDSKKAQFLDNLSAAYEAGELAQAIILDSRKVPATLPANTEVLPLA